MQARDEAKIRDHQEKAFGKREFTLSPDPYGSAGVIRGRYDALLEILRCDARSLSHSVRSAVRSLAGDPDLGRRPRNIEEDEWEAFHHRGRIWLRPPTPLDPKAVLAVAQPRPLNDQGTAVCDHAC